MMRSDNVFDWLDDALVKIFSKLPDAPDFLRGAAACRRFRALVLQMEDIVIDYNTPALPDVSGRDVEIALLLARGAKGALKSLKLVAKSDWCFDETSVLFWIAAASQSVKKLVILDGEGLKEAGPRLKAASRCLNLSHLHLTGPETHTLGAEALAGCRGGFKALEKLHLENVKMTNDSVTKLVGLCPTLKHLNLEGLTGVTQVQIQSSTLENVSLNVFTSWVDKPAEGFSDISLETPALQELSIGDLQNSLTVKDAPLKELRLENSKTDLLLDLGSKADIEVLHLQLDQWPPSFDIARTLPWSEFTGFLKHTRPQSLRNLTIPLLDNDEHISPATAENFFKHISELETLSFPASFAAACGFGTDSEEDAGQQILQMLEETVFVNLWKILYYVDEESPDCFEIVEALAKNSKKLNRMIIFADSGFEDFELSGTLIARILRFQYANPRIRVSIELPKKLVAFNEDS